MKLRKYRGRSRVWTRTAKNRKTIRLGRFLSHVRPTPGGWFLAEVFVSGLLNSVSSSISKEEAEIKQWAEQEMRRFYDADNLPAMLKRRAGREWPDRAGA